MSSIVRAVILYFVLLVIFRIAGKRSLSQITTFDFVLLLIIGESIQQALISEDYSVVNALLIVGTLVMVDILISLVKQRSPALDKILESAPLILVEDGKLIEDRMQRERIGKDDILEKARELQGLERLEDIQYAVLERSGGITIIPKTK